MTALQYLLELQRDWARSETYDMTTGIAQKLGGGYGHMGMQHDTELSFGLGASCSITAVAAWPMASRWGPTGPSAMPMPKKPSWP